MVGDGLPHTHMVTAAKETRPCLTGRYSTLLPPTQGLWFAEKIFENMEGQSLQGAQKAKAADKSLLLISILTKSAFGLC